MPDQATALLMLDRRALAAAMSISPTTLDRWISEGYLPSATISRGSKIRLWSRAVIEAWIAERGNQNPDAKSSFPKAVA